MEINGFVRPKWVVMFYSRNKLYYFLRKYYCWVIFMKKYDDLSFNFKKLKYDLGNTLYIQSNSTQKLVDLPNPIQSNIVTVLVLVKFNIANSAHVHPYLQCCETVSLPNLIMNILVFVFIGSLHISWKSSISLTS
jgi:hypothetical protein